MANLHKANHTTIIIRLGDNSSVQEDKHAFFLFTL